MDRLKVNITLYVYKDRYIFLWREFVAFKRFLKGLSIREKRINIIF